MFIWINNKDKDVFYARALDKILPSEDAPWYAPVPLGKHTLHSMVKKINTKSTTVSGLQQQLRKWSIHIQERTGHRSLEGLQSYERSYETQHRALSSLLSSSTLQAEKEIILKQSISLLETSDSNLQFHDQ